MCSRKTIRKYIANAGMLSLMYAAKKIKKSNEEGSVITAGWEDTKKKWTISKLAVATESTFDEMLGFTDRADK